MFLDFNFLINERKSLVHAAFEIFVYCLQSTFGFYIYVNANYEIAVV